MAGRIVKYAVPVWVYVADDGSVTEVHVDDERLVEREPLGWVPGEKDQTGWHDDDVIPATPELCAELAGLRDQLWPGWEFGW